MNSFFPPKAHFPLTLTIRRVVDLSHVITSNIPCWEGDPPVEFETVAEIEKDGYFLRRFSLGEHSATHINAPNSFHSTGMSIDAYPADSFVVPAIAINIRHAVANDPNYRLSIANVLLWEQQFGQIQPRNLVLLNTGWQSFWSDSNAFFNYDSSGNYHFPGFSLEVTEFLLRERQIAGVGIDTHGIDGSDSTFASNRLMLESPHLVLENLTNLDQLPPVGAVLVIGVLRLQGGSGSPAAVTALLP
ncbi:MAG: cyclase family protein [Chroococcales cyanobacterium]